MLKIGDLVQFKLDYSSSMPAWVELPACLWQFQCPNSLHWKVFDAEPYPHLPRDSNEIFLETPKRKMVILKFVEQCYIPSTNPVVRKAGTKQLVQVLLLSSLNGRTSISKFWTRPEFLESFTVSSYEEALKNKLRQNAQRKDQEISRRKK